MDREEETALAVEAKGDRAALNALVAGMRPRLEYINRRYWPRHERVHDDLVQEGSIAIAAAVPLFDAGRGRSFWTFSRSVVRARMAEEFGRAAYAVTIPEHARAGLTRAAAEGLGLEELLGRAADRAIPAYERSGYASAALLGGGVFFQVWLDEPMGGDEADVRGDLLAAEGPGALDELTAGEVSDELMASLARLSAPKREAFCARALEGLPLRDVGERLGVSEERARQVVAEAGADLRRLAKGSAPPGRTPVPASPRGRSCASCGRRGHNARTCSNL